MRNTFLFLVIFIAFNSLYGNDLSMLYRYPVPNSEFNSPQSKIIFKSSEEIYGLQDFAKNIIVRGSLSGIHEMNAVLCESNKTIVFTPLKPFLANEDVNVSFGKTGILKTINNNQLIPEEFSFKISPVEKPIRIAFDEFDNAFIDEKNDNPSMLGDTVPADFPNITVNSIVNPSPGYTFISNNSQSFGNYAIILDRVGKPFKYQKTGYPVFDFKVQPDGRLSYQQPLIGGMSGNGYAPCSARLLDTNFNIIDSYQCVGGYLADVHDFVLAPNGHAFLISYDPQPVDMSKIVDGGNPNSIVIGAVVQEFDAGKNLVFQWRSWDHIPITDSYADMTKNLVDYMHINAVEFDIDGNIMISSRLLSEITKIDRTNGNIIWRLGGKSNQFQFINEHQENAPTYFSEQHDIRRLVTGNITLFDNGNQHVPEHSRAVEYKIDETNKTATMVWENRHQPDIISKNQGSCQRLDNGNTFIGWGGAGFQGLPSISEVTSDGQDMIVMSLPMGVTFGQTTYRAYKFPWPTGLARFTKKIDNIGTGETATFSDTLNYGEVTPIASTSNNSITLTEYDWAAMNVDFDSDAPWVPKYRVVVNLTTPVSSQVKFKTDVYKWLKFYPDKFSIYYRLNEGSGKFTKLSTNYNSATGEISAISNTGSGEYIFGMEKSPVSLQAPKLITPLDGSTTNSKIVNRLNWSSEGLISQYHLMIAKDKDFTSIVLDSQNIKDTKYDFQPDNNITYYWKVRAANSAGWSQFSNAWSFQPQMPFVQVISPKSGDKWVRDSANYIITWSTNVKDTFQVDLYQNGSYFIPLFDSIKISTGSIWWAIPAVVPFDSTYQIKVTSVSDTTVYSFSPQYFTVREMLSVNDNINPSGISIIGSYPLPADNRSIFRLQNNSFGNLNISVYDTRGNIIYKDNLISLLPGLVNYELNTSNYPSGVYYFEIFSGIEKSVSEFQVVH